VDLGRLRRNADLLAAAPGDRADVAVGELVGGDHVAADLIDLLHGVRDLEIEHASTVNQSLGMLGELENLAGVGALAFKDRASVVQGVGQDVDLGLAPGDQRAIEPDETVAIVKRSWLGHQFSPWTFAQRFATKGWLGGGAGSAALGPPDGGARADSTSVSPRANTFNRLRKMTCHE